MFQAKLGDDPLIENACFNAQSLTQKAPYSKIILLSTLPNL